MRLELRNYGLIKPNTHTWVGYSKCGPSRNMCKFYKTDIGRVMGYDHDHALFGHGIRFVI